VLRLHRPAVLVWAAFLLLVLGELLWVHLSGAPTERACRTDWSGQGRSCGYQAFTDVNNVMNFLGEALSYAPCAVAAWAGGALIGRELESGTAKLAWTQAASPARWLTARLAAAALPLVAGGTVLALAYGRVRSVDGECLVGDWTWDRVFVPSGPLLPALLLCALATGAVAGLALRRTLPALAAALAVTLVLRRCLRYLWLPLRDTLTGFWPLHLAATAMTLTLTTLTITAAHALLRHQVA
jgi:hypothetical protein